MTGSKKVQGNQSMSKQIKDNYIYLILNIKKSITKNILNLLLVYTKA